MTWEPGQPIVLAHELPASLQPGTKRHRPLSPRKAVRFPVTATREPIASLEPKDDATSPRKKAKTSTRRLWTSSMGATFGSFSEERSIIELDSSCDSISSVIEVHPAQHPNLVHLTDENIPPQTVLGPLESQTRPKPSLQKARNGTLEPFLQPKLPTAPCQNKILNMADSKESQTWINPSPPPTATSYPQASTSTGPPNPVISTAMSASNVYKAPNKPVRTKAEIAASRKAKKAAVKAQLNKLPRYHWKTSPNAPQTRIYTSSPADLTNGLAALCTQEHGHIVGFDMEWNFVRATGVQHRTALVQIASRETAILFQVSQKKQDRLPPCLINFLADPKIIKIGVNIKGDAQKLHRDFEGLPPIAGLFELSHLARRTFPERWPGSTSALVSLQELTGEYVEKYLDKGNERTSDWQKGLNSKQLDYATGDVVSALDIYLRIYNLAPKDAPPPQELLFTIGPSLSAGPQTSIQDGKTKETGHKAKAKKGQPTHSLAGTRKEEAFVLAVEKDLVLDIDQGGQVMGIKPITFLGYVCQFIQGTPGAEGRFSSKQTQALVSAIRADKGTLKRHRAVLKRLERAWTI